MPPDECASFATPKAAHVSLPHGNTTDRYVTLEGAIRLAKLYTFKEAAARLAISQEFCRKLQRSGHLRVLRLGQAARIPESEIERLCERGVPASSAWIAGPQRPSANSGTAVATPDRA
jgi:excisionase family DNA binding protein